MSLRKTLLAAVSTLGLLASPFAVSEETYPLRLAETWGPNSGLLGDAPRIGIEAAVRQGWDGLLLRPGDGFVGMTGFGASAPAPDLYRHFGITAEAVADLARHLTRSPAAAH